MVPTFLALSESSRLGASVCSEAGLAPTPLEERSFEGGEFKLRPLQSVRGRCVFVLQTLASSKDAPVADRLVRLLFLIPDSVRSPDGPPDAGRLLRQTASSWTACGGLTGCWRDQTRTDLP